MKATPIVIERHYGRPRTFGDIEAADEAAQWCIHANGGHAMFHAIVEEGRRSICLYEAPDADAMRRVHDIVAARHPVTIWPSTEHWAERRAPRPPLH